MSEGGLWQNLSSESRAAMLEKNGQSPRVLEGDVSNFKAVLAG